MLKSRAAPWDLVLEETLRISAPVVPDDSKLFVCSLLIITTNAELRLDEYISLLPQPQPHLPRNHTTLKFILTVNSINRSGR
jgi:hypothetical protein